MKQSICSRCRRKLAVDEFARDASKSSGHKSYCKACDNVKSRAYYAANRERVLARKASAKRAQRKARRKKDRDGA